MVKLLHLSSNSGANPSEDASCRILRKLPNVVHVHFISSPTALTPVTVLVSLAMRSQPYHAPLEGLTGLNVGNKNWEAVMLAVRNLALSLRRLEISSLHPNKPGASQEVYAAAQQTELRSLMYFKTASPPPRGDVWLEVALLDRWDLPYVTKLMVGASGGGSNESNTLSKLDWTETCERLCFVNLAEVKVNLRLIREMEELAELAFGLGVPVTSHLNAATFKTALDGTSGKGRCVSKTVTSVVIWEGTQREASPREDACLVELVNRDRLPSLEKVVWIAKSRDTSTMTWSGSVDAPLTRNQLCLSRYRLRLTLFPLPLQSNLMTWLLALTRAGVEVVVQ